MRREGGDRVFRPVEGEEGDCYVVNCHREEEGRGVEAPDSLLFPGDYLSMNSCYYQVLVEVPRPTTARGIRLGLRG